MAASTNNSKISKIFQELQTKETYPCPNGLEGFHKMAVSSELKYYLQDDKVWQRPNQCDDAKFHISLKEEKDAKGHIKQNFYTPKELEGIATTLLKQCKDISTREQITAKLFTEIFTRIASHSFEGQSIFSDKIFTKLKTVYENYDGMDPEGKLNAVRDIIDGLPQNSICIIAHMLYLGKHFIQMNEYVPRSSTDKLAREFENSRIPTKEENPKEPLVRFFFRAPCVSIFGNQIGQDRQVIQQMIFDLWKAELKFTPILNTGVRRSYKLQLPLLDVMEILHRSTWYDRPSCLEGFYTIVKSDLMIKNIQVEGAFIQSSIDSELNKIIEKKDDKNANKLSPSHLTSIAKRILVEATDPILFINAFKRLTTYYFKGSTVLDDEEYSKLKVIFNRNRNPNNHDSDTVKKKKPRVNLNKVFGFIDSLPEKSVNIIAYLIILSHRFVFHNGKKNKNDDAAVAACFQSGPAALIYNEDTSQIKPIEYIVMHCWLEVFNFVLRLSDEAKSKYEFFR